MRFTRDKKDNINIIICIQKDMFLHVPLNDEIELKNVKRNISQRV